MDLWIIGLLIFGLVLLIVGAEVLVRGASRLAAVVGISPLVIGLTVVAFGTSSPELAVSLQAALQGQADITIGNIVGSSIFNILLILGLSAVIVPLTVAQQLVQLDVPIMIGASLALLLFALDQQLAAWEGGLLFAALIGYISFLIRQSRRETAQIVAEYEQEFGSKPPAGVGTWLFNLVLLVVGLAMLVYGSRGLVDAAVAIAQTFGISELVIGLTIVAMGTSMPEVATSVVAAIRGERDIAVGNAVGSNILNIMAVLGLTVLVTPGGVHVSLYALEFDIPFMVIVAIACLPIFFTRNRIDRWEGLIFLFYLVAYIGYLIMRASETRDGLPYLFAALGFFLFPLTLLTLIIAIIREVNRRRATRSQT